MQSPVLEHAQIVRQGVVQSHHLQLRGLFHNLLGALAGDDDPRPLGRQRLGTGDDLPAAVGRDEHIHIRDAPLAEDGPGLFLQLLRRRHDADLVDMLHLFPVRFLLHTFHLIF